ncbi:MAG: permease prefix domain 1-containing protein [Aminipila sp.]
MNQIRNYIEAMFSNLPKTQKVVEMKLNMLENMEEKFQELLKAGKSENEAVGIILADFGSMEELKEELGISNIQPENIEYNPHIQENSVFNEDCETGMPKLIKSTIFSIALIIFLCVGFFWNLWHPGWIIFVVAAMITKLTNAIICNKNGYTKE